MTILQKPPQAVFDSLPYLKTQLHAPPALPAHAKADFIRIAEFIYSYRGSEATAAAYRNKCELLALWRWYIDKGSLQTLTREDVERFIEFCQNPPPAWIGMKNVARFIEKNGERISNPQWRPFVVSVDKAARRQGAQVDPANYFLSQKSMQAIFSVLSSFYTYLVQEEYVTVNPVLQIRQKSKFLRKQQTQRMIRRLSELQWQYVIETAEQLAEQDPATHERTLFIMSALFSMYLRISELAESARWAPRMADFHVDLDGNWWFTTVGKGNKQRDISVSDTMLNALKRYRHSLGLSSLPSPHEQLPLIPKVRGKGGITSTRQIRGIVQFCFDRAIERLQQDGLMQEAELLMAATVHWLRHTGISEDVKHRPREHVRDDAGHGSSKITDQYIDVELRERHASAKHKLIRKPE